MSSPIRPRSLVRPCVESEPAGRAPECLDGTIVRCAVTGALPGLCASGSFEGGIAIWEDLG